MGILSKRAAKYYFLHGLKLSAVSIGSILCAGFVWTLSMFGVDDWNERVIRVIRMVLQFTRYIVPYLNLCYSIYSPSWYDSMVLSMGARRKDIFYGNIVRQSVFIFANALFFCLFVLISGQTSFIVQVLPLVCISFLSGAFGLYMGHKVKKHGRVILFLATFVFVILFNVTSILVLINDRFMAIFNAYKPFMTVGAVILFVILEVLVYRVNKKSMVVL